MKKGIYRLMRKFLAFLLIGVFSAANAQETYKLENVNGKYVCQGSVNVSKNDKAIYGGMVLWALDQVVDANAKNAATLVNTAELSVSMRPSVQVEDETIQNYSFNLTLQAKNNHLTFLIDNVRCTPKGFFGSITAVNLDKIKVEKKPKHKVLIDEFALLCNSYVQEMIIKIKGRSSNFTHWEAIQQGQVVKGMNENECLIAVGKPDTITQNPQRVMWQYGTGMIVVFENGEVTGLVK